MADPSEKPLQEAFVVAIMPSSAVAGSVISISVVPWHPLISVIDAM